MSDENESTALQLLARLSALGVSIRVESGQLRIRAPKGVLDEKLRATLAQYKPQLLDMLSGDDAANDSIAPASRDAPLPASTTQERFLFLARMLPDSVAYNLPNVHRLAGPLDVAAFERSIHGVVARHEALRTRFVETASGPVQHIEPEPFHDFAVIDAASEQSALVLAHAEASVPFDLYEGPLLRVVLYRCSAELHLLCWTVHHVISDGWSSMIFLRELEALYQFEISGEPPGLSPLLLHYADFGAWERERLSSGALDEQLDYWRERFSQPPEPLALPTDYVRPVVLSYRGASIDFELSETLSISLREFARTLGVTPFTVLLAGWKILLSRHSGQSDVCVGSPIARRNQTDLEDVYGCLINALALRSELTDELTVAEFVRSVRRTCVDAFARQDVPFERVVEAVSPIRDTSVTPLFQSMFIYHVQDGRKVEALGPILMERLEVHAPGSKFDVTLELTERAGGATRGFIEYATDLFKEDTIERMIGHYRVLLEGLVRNPSAQLAALPLLDEHERTRVLDAWNATGTDYPRDVTVAEMFIEQVKRTPAATAVIGPSSRELTYGALDADSNRLARHLQSLKVGPGDRVGVYLDRDVEMLTVLLAVIKSGAAYVPLDPLFPYERLVFMVDNAGLALVITQATLEGAVPGGGTQRANTQEHDADADNLHRGPAVLVLESLAEKLKAYDDQPISLARADTTAYVIYTSGSTGQPKGVMVNHRSLVNFLCAMKREPGLSAEDRLLALTTLSFDIAGLELYLPLMVGAEVHLANRDEMMDPKRLAARLESGDITVMQGTPAAWRMLLDSGWSGRSGFKALCGGEPMPRELAEQLIDLVGEHGELWNLYGPTETTIWSTAARVRSGTELVPVGRPIANTRTYVLDGRGGPTPIGVAGELWIGGDGVAEGYLGQAGLTSERFVADPFAEESGLAGARMYRTGDRARWRVNGELEVLGRLDEQVKVRGYRIEPGEIRAQLIKQAEVSDAVVVVNGEGPQARLVAYLVPKPSPGMSSTNSEEISLEKAGQLDTDRLREALHRVLPEYMVPSIWVELLALPMTPNGKVDRRALSAIEHSTGVSPGGTELVEARTETERKVAAVWAELLGLEKVGVTEGFFSLGGHSLLAVRLVVALQERLGMKVELLELFQGKTVTDIACAFDEPNSNAKGRDNGVSRNWSNDTICRLLTRSDSSLTPLFMVGSNPQYRAAVGVSISDRPVYQLDAYGLQSRSLSERRRTIPTIEAIAERFLESIRAVQPEGPYLIGGGCEGSLIAFELARRLYRDGEQVQTLMTWGTPAPGLPVRTVFAGSSLRRLWWQMQSILKRGSLRELGWRGYRSLIIHEVIEHSLFSAMLRYDPGDHVPGSMHLVVLEPMQGQSRIEDETMGWRERMKDGVEVYYLPGNHDTWLRDHVHAFGEFLANCLSTDEKSQSSQLQQSDVNSRSLKKGTSA